MPTHPKTVKSFSVKSDQYLREDCTELPLTDLAVIRELIGDLSGKLTLCAGCGAGVECKSLAALGAIVEGVDTSESLLEIAKSQNPDLNFKLASLESLPFSNGYFDFIQAQADFAPLGSFGLVSDRVDAKLMIVTVILQ